jgi:hypothetical protein
MKRRAFNKQIFAFGSLAPAFKRLQKVDPIIGHNDFTYRVEPHWCKADKNRHPVLDCHEMVLDSRGLIYLSTNDVHNNILVFNKDGEVVDAFGTEYPGAHGLSLHDENGTEFLYLTDYERHRVFKMTKKGRVVQEFACPVDAGIYPDESAFKPTETCVGPDGDVYVADGYGLDYILRYSPDGSFKSYFGGKKELNNAHGICLDVRDSITPKLLVSSRAANQLKSYDLDGQLQATVDLPGAWMCRPVIHGDEVYLAVLVSKMPWDSASGFVCILDKNNTLISVPGGSKPTALDRKDGHLHQTVRVFRHPHDVLVDPNGDVYVAQWNSNRVYPIRLIRTQS